MKRTRSQQSAPEATDGSERDAGLPTKKKQRAGPVATTTSPAAASQEEDAELWNLLSALPFTALHRLLQFLSLSSPLAPSERGEVPEICRVRAQSVHFEPELEWGEDVPPGEEEAFEKKMMEEEKRRRRLSPYDEHQTGARHQSQNGVWSSVGALRLTCHEIKNAVDHALGGASPLLSTSFFGPLDRFLTRNFSSAAGEAPPPLPLISNSAEAAGAKAKFRKVAELTLGAVGARIHQARVGELLAYVWGQWGYSPKKLAALQSKLLSPTASAAGRPLLKMEHVRREDDYLGRGYALGVMSFLSLGLPDMPQERVELALSVQQAWDYRDEGWDLQLVLELHTTSPVWKQRLSDSTAKDCEDDDEMDEEEEKKPEEGTDGSFHVVVFDYYRSRGDLDGPAMVKYSMLRRLWRCVGLGGRGEHEGDEGEERWKGKEVLTTLLACLGFAWKPDVELLWDEDEDGDDETDVGANGYSATQLRKAAVEKRRERHEMKEYLDELDAFFFQHQLNQERLLEAVARRVIRFVGQRRLARAVAYFQDRARGEGLWASTRDQFPLSNLAGCEVANELRVLYARYFDVAPGEYSNFQDSTVELAFPVSTEALLSALPAGVDHDQPPSSPVHVALRVSDKSGNPYSGAVELSVVSVRVIGQHGSKLLGTVASLVAAAHKRKQEGAQAGEEEEEEDDDDEEGGDGDAGPDGTVVIHLRCDTPDSEKSVAAPEAVELIGRLLGLSLRDPGAAGEDDGNEGTPFSRVVLRFLSTLAKVATWDADEGTFPVPAPLRERWESGAEDEEEAESAEQAGEAKWTTVAENEAMRLFSPRELDLVWSARLRNRD